MVTSPHLNRDHPWGLTKEQTTETMDTMQKNGRLIPTVKRGKEIKQQWKLKDRDILEIYPYTV